MAEKNTKGAISIRNVTKIYDPEGVNVMAVDDCSLEIKSGEVCMIVGPSGCGKTTLLNAIAGFHSITEGEIYLDNEILCGPNKPLAEQGSDRIVVFQHGALFPWKTLQENVAYGPIVQKVLSKNEALDKAGSLLEEAGIGDMMKKYPGEVSSGMARRAEIVRALINNPKVLFLDEPTTGLDPQARRNMWDLISEIKKDGKTIILTTHYMEEAEILCDRVAIIDSGEIVKIDSPKNLIAELINSGFVTEKKYQEATLEDVFLDLTGKSLREY